MASFVGNTVRSPDRLHGYVIADGNMELILVLECNRMVQVLVGGNSSRAYRANSPLAPLRRREESRLKATGMVLIHNYIILWILYSAPCERCIIRNVATVKLSTPE
jgi:hypothetical protein